MNLFIKILWAVGFTAVVFLGWFLLQETKRANYLENYIRTQPARNARWNGRNEDEENLTDEEKLNSVIEKVSQELQNKKSNDQENI
jgi:hypothetical protein